MRIRRSIAVAAVAVPMLVGCGEVQEAQQQVEDAQQQVEQAQEGLNTAGECADAIKLAGFTPNFSDPAKAAEQAQAKAEQAQQLAEKTSDQTLQQNLEAVQSSLQEAASGDITVENSTEWVSKYLEQTSNVLATCGGNGGSENEGGN